VFNNSWNTDSHHVDPTISLTSKFKTARKILTD
jgi:hypothetical protein